MNDIHIAILAGGQSRRMGRDKAALPWNGASLLETLAEEARRTGLPVVVVGRSRPSDWRIAEVAFLPDAYPDTGPLGGVLTALEAGGDAVLAVACDMPYLDTRALEWLLDIARSLLAETPGVAARSGEQIEPLFAVYGKSLRGEIARRLGAGRLSLSGLIADAGFSLMDVPADMRPALMNVNTPEEWRNLDRKDTP